MKNIIEITNYDFKFLLPKLKAVFTVGLDGIPHYLEINDSNIILGDVFILCLDFENKWNIYNVINESEEK